MDQDSIGKFILDLRNKNKMTQSQFAAKIGVTAQAVSKWENGRGIPDVEMLKIISTEFDVRIDSILGGKVKSNKCKIIIISAAIMLVLTLIVGLFLIFNDNDFNLGVIDSGNEIFSISGASSFSDDEKSIHITSIDYLNTDENLYMLMELALYETEGDLTRKLVDAGKVNTNKYYINEEAMLIDDLIKDADLFIDNYNSICLDLENPNLFILIKLLSSQGIIITHEIPLIFDYTCD